MSTQATGRDSVKVWDPLVRIFHWSLVGFFFLAYFTEDEWLDLHVIAGYTVAGLVGFRLIWGFIGPRYARFAGFVSSPSSVIDYLKRMRQFDVPHYLGHNPAAGAMVIALLLSLIAISLTGMSIIATEGQGPLAATWFATLDANWLEEIHEFFANFTLLLVLLHVAGVFFSSLLEGDNLPRAMLTGYKKYHSEAVDADGSKS